MSTPEPPAGARTIVLEGPGMNALGSKLMDGVREQLEAAGGAPVLLTGSGKAFSAGLDLKEIATLDRSGMEAFLRRLAAVTEALFHYPGPTVAVVNGHAIAGGAILALCCDHRVAVDGERVRIGLNEIALGLRFPPKVLAMVRYRLPWRRVEQVVLGAALHSPAEAERLGLVDEVHADPMPVGIARLAALASHPQDAYASTKADLRGPVTRVSAEAEAQFVEHVVPAWTSDALRQRIAAVLGG